MEMNPIARLAGILIGCPFDTPLKNCVFNAIRQNDLSARMRWMYDLPKHEKERFATIHQQCMSQREQIFWKDSANERLSDGIDPKI